MYTNISINGENIKLIERYDVVVKRYQKEGSFEKDTFKLWDSYCKNNNTVVDIGAYTGIFSIYAALKGCQVINFEPNTNIFNRMVENVELNEVSSLVCPVNIALSDFIISKAYITEKKGVPLTSAGTIKTDKPNMDKPFSSTSITTLDEYFRSRVYNSINAVKIDAERSEFKILNGAKFFIKNYKPETFIIEILDDWMIDSITEFMDTAGYDSVSILDNVNHVFKDKVSAN